MPSFLRMVVSVKSMRFLLVSSGVVIRKFATGFTPVLPTRPAISSKIGFSFTPGGLLFPYHLGVAKCLEIEGFLTSDTPLAGSSAGALAAAVVGCGLDIDTASELSKNVFDDCRTGGTAFRLKEVVREGLEGALPSNAHEIMNNRAGAVTVGITQLFPRPKGMFISRFESRDDLIEVLLGSCHVPFWFSARPYMQVRGKATVDGFFAVPRAHFGAPDIPTADEVVRVTVFPTTSIEMQSEKPGDLISPDLLDRYQSGRFMELLNYALNPANEYVMEELFNAGFESGGVWCDRYGEEYRRRHEEKYSAETLAASAPGL